VPAALGRGLFSKLLGGSGLADDETKRTELEHLKSSEAQGNPAFEDARRASHQFQEALTALFFDHPRLSELTRKYGVF